MIDTDDKLSDDITLKNIVILMAFDIKDDGNKFYPQRFLDEVLLKAWKLASFLVSFLV